MAGTEQRSGFDAAPGSVWTAACATLKGEMGADAFGSWLGQASLRQDRDGALVLVTPTGIARDWIRNNAWRRIQEVWAAKDPQRRGLILKSRVEFEGAAPAVSAEAGFIAMDPVSSDVPEIVPARKGGVAAQPGLQERLTFQSFVTGPANEFADRKSVV